MHCPCPRSRLLSLHLPSLRTVATYLILRPLRHHLRPLLLNNHLLLAVRQRPRDTQQQRRCRHDPQRLTAEQQSALRPGGNRLVLGADAATCGCGNDVFQCADALVESLVGDEFGFGFEVGLWGVVSFSSLVSSPDDRRAALRLNMCAWR